MEEVPCRTSRAPLRPLVYARFNSSRNKGAFRLPGAMWDHFRCTVEKQKGVFVKGRFWRMCPRSGLFWGAGKSKIIALEEMSVLGGNICQNRPG